jgi:glutathione S-transferase
MGCSNGGTINNKPQNYELDVYIDWTSPPSRSVVALCLLNNIKHNIKHISILKGEAKTEEYKRINPFCVVPTIRLMEKGKEVIVHESHNILRFLSNKFNLDEKWYPTKDFFRRAEIDWYLDFHHSMTGAYFSKTVYAEYIKPLLVAQGVTLPDAESGREGIPKVLGYMEDRLKKHKYIADDEMSIADLRFSAECFTLQLVKFDFSPWPCTEKYLKEIAEIPEIQQVNAVLKSTMESESIQWSL